MSMRLSDNVIVRPWSENKGHCPIKDPWTFSKVMGGEVKRIITQHRLPTKCEVSSSRYIELKRGAPS